MFDPGEGSAAFCRYCGDKPGGCVFCQDLQAERARAVVIEARVHTEMEEAYRCCMELLNAGRKLTQPRVTPDRDMLESTALVLAWKRQQDARAAAVPPAPITSAEQATSLRFGAIEWEAGKKAGPRMTPRSLRRLDL